MATPWVILSRIVRSLQEQHAAAAVAVAVVQEQHAAAAVAVAVAQEQHAADAVAVAEEHHAAAAGQGAEAQHDAAAGAVAVAQEQHVLAVLAETVPQEKHAAAVAAVEVAVAQEKHAAAAVAQEQHAAAAGQGAQAPHDAAAGAPDFTLPLAPRPRVTVLAAGRGAHPKPDLPDKYPYIIAACSHCLLAHFSVEPFDGTQFNDLQDSHLVVVRDFHTADSRTTASAERLPDRFGPVPNLSSIGNVVLATNDRGDYLVAHLKVFRGSSTGATLTYHQSTGRALDCLNGTRALTYPLSADDDREWIPHGAVFVDGTLWWFDLRWGILSYSYKAAISDTEQDLVFHELPGERELHHLNQPPHIHTKRCVTASGGKLRYVEIITDGEAAARVCMWSRSRTPPDGDDWQWHPKYDVRFEEIWDGDSYKATGLPRAVPALLVVCPSDPELVYFALEQRIFGVNVPARTVLHVDDEPVNIPRPGADPISGLYVVAWELPPQIAQGH